MFGDVRVRVKKLGDILRVSHFSNRARHETVPSHVSFLGEKNDISDISMDPSTFSVFQTVM